MNRLTAVLKGDDSFSLVGTVEVREIFTLLYLVAVTSQFELLNKMIR